MRPARLPLLLALLLPAAAACKDRSKDDGAGAAAGDQATPNPAARGPLTPTGAGGGDGAGGGGGAAAPLPADPGGAGGTHAWSLRMGGPEADSGRDLAVDAEGHAYVVGVIRAAAEMGEGTTIQSRAADGFLARVSPEGKVLWSMRMGGDGDDIASAVAVDPRGNAVVTGWFSGSLELGDGTLESRGADDVFVASIGPDGKRVWARRFGGSDVDGGDGVAVDHQGNVAVIGSFRTEVEVGKSSYVSGGGTDIVLALLAPDGEVKWSRAWGAVGPDEGRAVGFDRDGNLYALVEFSRAVDFGGGPLTSAGNRDMALVKLGPGGEHIWSRRYGAQLDELAVDLAVDASGSALVTGSFDDVLDMGAGEPMRTAGRSDVFVAKIAPDGTTRWARQAGEKDEDIGASITADPYGNVYATGWFWKSLQHGGATLPSSGKKEAFLLAWSPDGEPLWGRTWGAKEDDYGRGVAADGGSVYLVGTFHVGIDLGGGVLNAAAAAKASIPYGDVFVARLAR